MGYRRISAHDLLVSHFCATCGVSEVKADGDVCDNCTGFLKALRSDGPSRLEIALLKREEKAVGEIPKLSENTIAARRNGQTQKCAVEGCEEEVTFGVRGLGVYCTKLQENGKTHRQERIETINAEKKARHLEAVDDNPEIEEGEFEVAECVFEERHGAAFCLTHGFVHDSSLAVIPQQERELVHHPDHYGGGDNPYETIKVIEAWELGFHLGNAVKYISRAGKKSAEEEIIDLEKARFYLDREIQLRKDARAQEGVQQG